MQIFQEVKNPSSRTYSLKEGFMTYHLKKIGSLSFTVYGKE